MISAEKCRKIAAIFSQCRTSKLIAMPADLLCITTSNVLVIEQFNAFLIEQNENRVVLSSLTFNSFFMKKVHLILTLLAGASFAASAQTARLEIIHNSADAAAAEVDIYVNGQLFRDDFAFRTTTGFLTVPAGVQLDVAVAPGNSASASDALATFPFTLMDGGTYIAIASGIVSATGYNPATPFTIEVFADARETGVGAGTDVLVFHGATDAPAVDVAEVGVGAGVIINDLAYSAFVGYSSFLTLDYILQIQEGQTNTPVAAFNAPMQSLGLGGAAITVLASGFLDPSANSNGAAFGLFVSLGVEGALVALPSPTARVEVIHNAADLAAATVDVYLNGELALDNFAFRTTTGFFDLPAAMPLEIAVAGANSSSVNDALATFPLTLVDGESYIVVANGIVSPSGYTPATPFGLDIYAGARETAINSNETDILVYHGATDAPAVDVIESAVGAGTIVNDISYSEFQGYLSVGPASYQLDVAPAAGSPVLASYAVNTELAQGAAVTILASGFLNPSSNSNGPAFGLWYSAGVAGELQPLDAVITGINEVAGLGIVGLYPNPTNDNVTLSFDVIKGDRVTVDVVDVVGNRVINLDLGAVASGVRTVQLPTRDLAGGMYLVRFSADNGQVVQRLQVVK